MKGQAQLWTILQDKLETLRAGKRLPEAVRVAESALELALRVFPQNDPSLALSYERLGEIHYLQRDLLQARPYLLKALRIIEKVEAPDQRALYKVTRLLANICDSEGQTKEAITYYEKAIKAGMALGDIPHSELGTLLNNVALSYRRSGHQEAAEPCYLQALDLYEKQLGPEHPDVAAVLNNLGVFYTNERRFAEAEEMHQRALAIRRQAHPEGHSDIAQSKCNLAVVYHSRGNYKEAGALYRESLRVWEELPERPEDYEIVASNYADMLRSLGKARKASLVESRARKKRTRA